MADAAETSVVIPAYNKAASIGDVVRELSAEQISSLGVEGRPPR